jgi:hypothetical protein
MTTETHWCQQKETIDMLNIRRLAKRFHLRSLFLRVRAALEPGTVLVLEPGDSIDIWPCHFDGPCRLTVSPDGSAIVCDID